MTVQVVVTSPRVEAAPGDIVNLPVRLTNTSDSPASCQVVVVGLAERAGGDVRSPDSAPVPAFTPAGFEVAVPAGETIDVLSPVAVPWVLGIGEHTAAVEVTSDRPGDRPVLASFVISIGSVARVELIPLPSTMRGRRTAKFKLDVVNNEPVPVELALSADAPEVGVRFDQPAIRLQPGERALTTAKVRGPRHWSGEPTQHNLVITARGRASSTSTTAAYIQRPLFARRVRSLVAALAVVALWLGAIGGVALWWSGRADDDVATESFEVIGVDTDGDGVIDQFTLADGTVVTGIDTDGDGEPDAFFDATGNPVADPRTEGGADSDGGSGGEGGESADGADGSGDGSGDGSSTQTAALLRGTVTAGGDSTDIKITLTPIALGATPEPAAIQGFVGAPPPEAAKIWSARMVPPGSATLNPIRQTEPIAPRETSPESDGVWQIPDVELRRSYEIVFAKPGYNTQSFVVTPPADGSPLDLDVELEPATGAISGTVRGPGGALGGAEIVVTDGVLTFTTTSATVGDVGTWSVDQVSTPGVYTVSATLRGYGTEVRQVTLTAGQTFDAADLTMARGVGSISGRIIGPDGQPLGGVSITATNGDESRTTSSLTEGDIGSYNIPQLSIGATFTLAVSAPGYLSESRRTPVNGAESGINFGMTKTTLTLTGTVTSGTTGVGVANAGLTLTTGDLTFRAATVGGADRGRFAIADLPPGDYTVTVDHYQHVSATQLVTLTAGVTPPPLDVALERGSGLPALGTGSLVVEVVDPSAKTAEARQIKNATVRLIRTQTGEELPPVTQEAFNFRITDIPIGTYTLLVTAPRYNPAAPRQVSLGLSEERVEVQMLRLGQASGFVVDSLTTAKLTNYFVNIYRQPESPGDAPVFVLQGDSSTGLWQTPADSLAPGTYRVDIPDSSSPPGYLVRNDQVLDPAVVGLGAERNMKFVVPEGAVDPITVASIEADPYPTITGRVYRPAMPPDSVDIVPIDSTDLGVTMTCPAGTPVAAAVLDDAGVQGATPPLNDSWVITKQQIDAANLSGNCTLDVVGGTGFESNTVPLNGVDASDGVTSSDRRVHSALGPDAPSIGGTVFWLNGSIRVPIDNATITSTRATSYSVVENPGPNSPPAPIPTPASTTSNEPGQGSGNWRLDGQIIGVAPYLFNAPNFGEGRIDVRVDPAGTATATAGAGAAIAATPADGRFHVQMSAPTPLTLRGVITIETSGTANFGLATACGGPAPSSGICIIATSPTGTVINETTVGSTTIVRGTQVGNTLPFEIRGAAPGTWNVTITEPTNHDEFNNTIPVDRTILPTSAPVSGFDMSLVENGTLRLTLADGNGVPITSAPTIRLNGTTFPTTFVPASAGPPAVPAHFLVSDIPVDPVSPLASPGRVYNMSVTLTGYDTSLTQAVPVNVRAGATTPISLTLPKFGTLTGVIDGDDGFSLPAELNIQGDGTFNVQRVDIDGVAIDPSTPGYLAPTFSITNGTYAVSGPPGYYRLTINHPQFNPDATPPTDNFVPPLGAPAPSAVGDVFQIVNDVPNTPLPYVLPIIPGRLDISVVPSLAVTTPVIGASYQLFFGATSTVARSGLINSGTGGSISVPGILPGPYRLELRQYATPGDSATAEIAFPVITNITIDRAVANVGSIRTVQAPLPPLQPTVAGTILGQNKRGGPVPLPTAGVTYEVTSTYDEPAIIVSGTSVVPNPNQGNKTALIDTAAASTGTVSYAFSNVPVGDHQVTLASSTTSAMTGYTLVGGNPKPMPVAASGVVAGPSFVSEVENVTLRIPVSPGAYPNISTITLRSPIPAAAWGTVYTGTLDDDTDVITFVGVAPEIGNFLLSFTDDLHAPVVDRPVVVPPDLVAPFVVTTPLVTTTGTTARITGTATQRETDLITSDLSSTASAVATITLRRTSGSGQCSNVAPDSPCVITVAAGSSLPNYTFDVPAGPYELTTQRPGYTTQSLSFSVVAGAIRPQAVQISKLATFEATILNTTLPTSIEVVLLDDASPATVYTGTQVGNTFTFNVTPGVNYRLRATAPGFAPWLDPSSGYTLAGIGAVYQRSTTLVPRTINVTVTGNGGGAAPAGAFAIARFGALEFTDTTAPFSFSSVTLPTLPLGVTGKLVVDAPGHRAIEKDITAAATQTITADILPLTTVNGTSPHHRARTS